MLASSRYNQGASTEAIEFERAAVELQRQLDNRDVEAVARLRSKLAFFLNQHGNIDEASRTVRIESDFGVERDARDDFGQLVNPSQQKQFAQFQRPPHCQQANHDEQTECRPNSPKQSPQDACHQRMPRRLMSEAIRPCEVTVSPG